MIRKQSTDPIFDQVSVRLLDATHLNMNQKYVFLKNTNFRWAFDGDIVRWLFFLEYPSQVP